MNRACVHSGTLLHEAFSNAYPDTQLPNKAVHPLVKNIGTQEVFACNKCLLSDKIAEIVAISISSSTSAAAVRYGCKRSIFPLVSLFCE
jgi:hypothetical protein